MRQWYYNKMLFTAYLSYANILYFFKFYSCQLKKSVLEYHLLSAFIAQVVERIIGNDEVTGSTPVES